MLPIRSMVVAVTCAVAGLAGCMSAPLPGVPLAWVRTDGLSGRANPALADQFAADRQACGIAGTEDNAALQAAAPCMSRRGYVLVRADEVDATAAKFRAAAAAKLPPPPSGT